MRIGLDASGFVPFGSTGGTLALELPGMGTGPDAEGRDVCLAALSGCWTVSVVLSMAMVRVSVVQRGSNRPRVMAQDSALPPDYPSVAMTGRGS